MVDAVGAHVHDFKEGDEVFGAHGQPLHGRGTHAEYVIANSAALVSRRQEFPERGGVDSTAAVTAMICVEALGPALGTRVLVVGASGVVGSLAVQLAGSRGATIGVARAVSHDYIRELERRMPLTMRLDHREWLFIPRAFDAIIDLASDGATVRLNPGARRGCRCVPSDHTNG